MDRVEKAQEVMQRAESLGFKLEFDFGFIRVVKPISGNPPERREAIIEELGKYLPEIRRLVERRATTDRAKDFFGQRVVFRDENNLSPTGQSVLSGVLTSASSNGLMDVSIKEGFEVPRRITSKAESLLIVMDEEEADSDASAHNDTPKSERPRRGVFDRLRGPRAV
jgi:hypothetical protein